MTMQGFRLFDFQAAVASNSNYFWVTKDNIDQARCAGISKKS